MKPGRAFEFVCVPLALACAGWYATPLAVKLIGLLGRQYVAMSPMGIVRPVLMASACGLAAGVAAVVAQKRREGRDRWSFYARLAFSVPLGAAVIFVIEAVRPRLAGAFGLPAVPPDISSVPFWILAVGFWLPFLALLRKNKPDPTSEVSTGRDQAEHGLKT